MVNMNLSGGLDVEQIITHIIEADLQARNSMESAETVRKSAETTIAERQAAMRADYMRQAEEHVAQFKKFEEQSAAEEFEKSHDRYERQLALLQQTRAEKLDGWVDEIVGRVLTGK